MTNFLMNFFAIIIAISLVVGVHEFGHFLIAKLSGVKVLRFSIGFGKPIWRRVIKKTEYVIGILPFGGYVRLLDERESKVEPSEQHMAFNRQSCWKRFWIIFAGPLFNLFFAWFAFWIVFTAGIQLYPPIIGAVSQGSIAYNAGIKPQDKIIQVDNQKTLNWGAVMMALVLKYGDADRITLTVLSQGSKQSSRHVLDLKSWSLDKLRPSLTKSLGIVEYRPTSTSAAVNYLQFSPVESLWQSIKQMGFYLFFNFALLWKMITGVISLQSLSGPFGLLAGIVGATKQGFVAYCFFLGWLSINLAVVNLLPIPGLDGSHIFYILFEAIFKKPVSVRVQLLALRLGILLLGFLMIQTIINDVQRF